MANDMTFSNRMSKNALEAQENDVLKYFDTMSQDPKKSDYLNADGEPSGVKKIFFSVGKIQGLCGRKLAEALHADKNPRVEYTKGTTPDGQEYHYLLKGQEATEYRCK